MWHALIFPLGLAAFGLAAWLRHRLTHPRRRVRR